jgi:hypothetical protein
VPPAARQPQDTDATDAETIENVAPRFVGNVFELGASLWAVHAVQGSGTNSALRWYEIDETANSVLQTALVNDANRDFHEPSIAVNDREDVVIGYTCSGPALAASVCVSVGATTGGVTTFENPAVLVTGGGPYYRDFCTPSPTVNCAERNRWGDYSATVIDPTNPCAFFTFQEYTAVGATGDIGPGEAESGLWGTRLNELVIDACNRPPVCTAASASPSTLWPPDHKFRTVTIEGITDPDGDPLTVTIAGVFQDEPVNGKGDGNTAPDAARGQGGSVLLRAERAGGGDGRVYQILFTATDPQGASCSFVVKVGVPHDQGAGRVAVDSAPPAYNSFSPV